VVAAWLGFVGYVGYFVTIMAAVLIAGPVIPPAIVATVPVVLAIVGSLGDSPVSWRMLRVPLGLITLGLVLVNLSGFAAAVNGLSLQVVTGIAISFVAVSMWTLFAVMNRAALKRRVNVDARRWTAAMMIGGALEIALFIPIAATTGLLNIGRAGLLCPDFGIMLVASLIPAAAGSIAGSRAGTIASKRLPVGLAGQLIVTETVFATSFGLVASHRWPTWEEALGVASIVLGVVSALKVLQGAAASEVAEIGPRTSVTASVQGVDRLH